MAATRVSLAWIRLAWAACSAAVLYGVLPAIGCRVTTAAGTALRTRWYQSQSGYSYARPAIRDSLVYFGTGSGQVIARDTRTGTARWVTTVGQDAVKGANLIVAGGVVVAPIVNDVVGLSASAGTIVWRYSAPMDTIGTGGQGALPGQVVLSRIDADGEAVYIPAWGASVSAVDLSTGAARWIWQPGRAQTDTAASGPFRSGSMGVRLSGDTVYATVWHDVVRSGVRTEAWLVALDRLTGHELWRYVVPTYSGNLVVQTAPVVYHNLVIFTTTGGHEWAVDRFSRQLAWHHQPATLYGTFSGPALHGDVVYHDGGDSRLYALRASDGTMLWSAPFVSGAMDDLLTTERRVIFTNAYRLYIFDRATGRLVVETLQPNTSDSFFSSPAAYADGQVFVTVGDGAWSFDEP